MDKMWSVYMKYGETADTCSIFATVCPNHFEMCPIRVVYMVERILTLWNVRVSLSKFCGLVGRDFIIYTCKIVSKRS